MTTHLLAPSDMGARPKDFYAVATAPGLLAGMSYPRSNPWSSLHMAGYRWVVCLTDDKVPYDPAPLAVLYAARLQDQAGGIVPHPSDHEERCIREAVSLIVLRVSAAEGVVVHCAGGTGRTGTVIACTLKALGLLPHLVLNHMNTVNTARTKYSGWKGWPESVWQKEFFDRF